MKEWLFMRYPEAWRARTWAKIMRMEWMSGCWMMLDVQLHAFLHVQTRASKLAGMLPPGSQVAE